MKKILCLFPALICLIACNGPEPQKGNDYKEVSVTEAVNILKDIREKQSDTSGSFLPMKATIYSTSSVEDSSNPLANGHIEEEFRWDFSTLYTYYNSNTHTELGDVTNSQFIYATGNVVTNYTVSHGQGKLVQRQYGADEQNFRLNFYEFAKSNITGGQYDVGTYVNEGSALKEAGANIKLIFSSDGAGSLCIDSQITYNNCFYNNGHMNGTYNLKVVWSNYIKTYVKKDYDVTKTLDGGSIHQVQHEEYKLILDKCDCIYPDLNEFI